MSQQYSWPTHSWPLEGRCLYYALLGLTQAPGFAGGPDWSGFIYQDRSGALCAIAVQEGRGAGKAGKEVYASSTCRIAATNGSKLPKSTKSTLEL